MLFIYVCHSGLSFSASDTVTSQNEVRLAQGEGVLNLQNLRPASSVPSDEAGRRTGGGSTLTARGFLALRVPARTRWYIDSLFKVLG